MRSVILSVAAVLVCASGALAGNVLVNNSNVQFSGASTRQAEARYRLASTNYDMALANNGGAGSGTSRIVNELGNGQSLGHVYFKVTLSHVAGQGYAFKLQRMGTDGQTPGSTHELIWKDGAANLDNGNVLKSRSAINGQSATANGFNAIQLRASASASTAGAYMEFDYLNFTAAGQNVVGTIADMNAPPSVTQTLVSTAGFHTFDWTLEGMVRGNVSTGGGESQVFNVEMFNRNFVIVPMPTPITMAGAGLLVVAGLSRRRVK